VYPHSPERRCCPDLERKPWESQLGVGGKTRRRDIGTINRFDDSRIRNFLLKHASGLDFLAAPTQREPVVRDEERQLRTGTMKIGLFLSTWHTTSLGQARRTRSRVMHEPQAGTTLWQSLHKYPDQSIDCLAQAVLYTRVRRCVVGPTRVGEWGNGSLEGKGERFN
jgi:hypothetical protein